LTTLSQEESATSLEWSRDGQLLAAGRSDGRTQFFDREGTPVGLPLGANASVITDVSFSDNGRRLATAGLDRTGAIWALDGTRAIGRPLSDGDAGITQAAWIDRRRFVTAATDGRVVIRDAAGAPQRRASVAGEALAAAVDTKRRRIVVGGTDGVTSLGFDGQRERHLDLDGGWAQSVDVDPATGLVAVAVDNTRGQLGEESGAGSHVRVWDPSTGEEVGSRIRPAQEGVPIDVAWAPDGDLLAVSTDSNLLTLHDAETHRREGKPISLVDSAILAIAFSPDGTRIAGGTSSGAIRQWSVRTHLEVGSALTGHTAPVAGIAYSGNGTLLASTTSGTAQTRLWDAETGASIGDELVAGALPYTERTYSVEHYFASRPAFSPDGTQLVTVGPAGASAIWDLRPESWVEAACSLVSRDLSGSEWKRYLPDRGSHRIC
jgi:WD40 repeat protein